MSECVRSQLDDVVQNAATCCGASYNDRDKEQLKFFLHKRNHSLKTVVRSRFGVCHFMIAEDEGEINVPVEVLGDVVKSTARANTLYVAFMGSQETMSDWKKTNFKGTYVPIFKDKIVPECKVHSGFLDRTGLFPSKIVLGDERYKEWELVFCGHSLGGAVAAIATILTITKECFGDFIFNKKSKFRRIRCITFAAPLFVNKVMKEFCDRNGISEKLFQFVNFGDPIPRWTHFAWYYPFGNYIFAEKNGLSFHTYTDKKAINQKLKNSASIVTTAIGPHDMKKYEDIVVNSFQQGQEDPSANEIVLADERYRPRISEVSLVNLGNIEKILRITGNCLSSIVLERCMFYRNDFDENKPLLTVENIDRRLLGNQKQIALHLKKSVCGTFASANAARNRDLLLANPFGSCLYLTGQEQSKEDPIEKDSSKRKSSKEEDTSKKDSSKKEQSSKDSSKTNSRDKVLQKEGPFEVGQNDKYSVMEMEVKLPSNPDFDDDQVLILLKMGMIQGLFCDSPALQPRDSQMVDKIVELSKTIGCYEELQTFLDKKRHSEGLSWDAGFFLFDEVNIALKKIVTHLNRPPKIEFDPSKDDVEVRCRVGLAAEAVGLAYIDVPGIEMMDCLQEAYFQYGNHFNAEAKKVRKVDGKEIMKTIEDELSTTDKNYTKVLKLINYDMLNSFECDVHNFKEKKQNILDISNLMLHNSAYCQEEAMIKLRDDQRVEFDDLEKTTESSKDEILEKMTCARIMHQIRELRLRQCYLGIMGVAREGQMKSVLKFMEDVFGVKSQNADNINVRIVDRVTLVQLPDLKRSPIHCGSTIVEGFDLVVIIVDDSYQEMEEINALLQEMEKSNKRADFLVCLNEKKSWLVQETSKPNITSILLGEDWLQSGMNKRSIQRVHDFITKFLRQKTIYNDEEDDPFGNIRQGAITLEEGEDIWDEMEETLVGVEIAEMPKYLWKYYIKSDFVGTSVKNVDIFGAGGFSRIYKKRLIKKDKGRKLPDKIVVKEVAYIFTTVDAKKELSPLVKIRHHNIVQLYAIYPTKKEGICKTAMDLCNGDLSQLLLHSRWQGSWGQIRKIAKQIVTGVGYLHRVGIIHSNIKPTNVLLKFSGELEDQLPKLQNVLVKIADFGLRGSCLPDAENIYMAPEVVKAIRGGEYLSQPSSKADVYSAGILLYIMKFVKPPEFLDDGSLDMPLPPSKEMDQFMDLCNAMVKEKPQQRIDMGTVLKHPFFVSERKKDNKTVDLNIYEKTDFLGKGSYCEVRRYTLLPKFRRKISSSSQPNDLAVKKILVEFTASEKMIVNEQDSGAFTMHTSSQSPRPDKAVQLRSDLQGLTRAKHENVVGVYWISPEVRNAHWKLGMGLFFYSVSYCGRAFRLNLRS